MPAWQPASPAPGPSTVPGVANALSRRRVVVLGDVATDVLVRIQEPLAPASDTRAAIEVHPGGSGANQAAWLGSLGLEVHFIGRAGRDPFRDTHLRALRRHGVIPHLTLDPERPTGLIVVLVDPTGERSMLTDRGANLGLRPSDLPPALFRSGDHFHLSGYTLHEPETRAAALEALRLARAAGMTISVDPASMAPLARVGPARFLEWTEGADLCFPNLDEGRLLSDAAEPMAVAAALAGCYGAVALKLGREGAVWAQRGAAPVYLPAEPAAVVDSTGAGDAFCAGCLAHWLAGAPPAEALAAGLRLAAIAVSQVGARPPSPPWGRRARHS